MLFFAPAGDELEPYDPRESQGDETAATPSQLEVSISDPKLRAWASDLVNLWPLLGRAMRPEVAMKARRHTLLPRIAPLVIPGGRFLETYYWDSYWVVLGLLSSGLTNAAKNLVANLLNDVETFGFVPNGSRCYYLNRSQPPLLSDMVMSIYQAEGDMVWLNRAVQVLDAEYSYWMSGNKAVRILKKGLAGCSDCWVLNRYYSCATLPRPESYREDVATADAVVASMSKCAVLSSKEEGSVRAAVYRELATAAESGWDFSSRWMTKVVDKTSSSWALGSLQPTRCIPVDLNSLLYRMERNLDRAHATLAGVDDGEESSRHSAESKRFSVLAGKRRAAVQAVLWDREAGRWRDAWLGQSAHHLEGAFSLLPRGGTPGSSGDATASTANPLASCPPPRSEQPFLSDYAAPLWAGLADGDAEQQSR